MAPTPYPKLTRGYHIFVSTSTRKLSLKSAVEAAEARSSAARSSSRLALPRRWRVLAAAATACRPPRSGAYYACPVPSASSAPRRLYPDRHYALIPFSGSPGQTRSPHQQDDCKPGLKSLSCSAFVICSGLRSGWSASYRSSRGPVQIFIPQGKQSTSASGWCSADEGHQVTQAAANACRGRRAGERRLVFAL